MLDLDAGTMPIPEELAKNKTEHRVYLTSIEVVLRREQLVARAPGTPLVFPTPEGGVSNRARFRDWADTRAEHAPGMNQGITRARCSWRRATLRTSIGKEARR
jgi:hypothetical protein